MNDFEQNPLHFSNYSCPENAVFAQPLPAKIIRLVFKAKYDSQLNLFLFLSFFVIVVLFFPIYHKTLGCSLFLLLVALTVLIDTILKYYR